MIPFYLSKMASEYLEELTERNAHGERLREIAGILEEQATAAGYDSVAAIFGAYRTDLAKINERHEKAGDLTPDLYAVRNFVRERLIANTRRYFGSDAVTLLGI